MKVYVINMERSVGRRAVIETQLKKLDLNYEIVNAVDGRQMSDEELERVTLRKDDFMKSQAGCMLSHLKVYKRILEEQDEYALVLEDDVIATEKSMKKVLQEIEHYLSGTHITLLTYYWCIEGSLKLNKENPKQKIKGQHHHHYFIYNPHQIYGVGRAAAYILSKQTAKNILDYQTPKLICQADSWSVYSRNNVIGGVSCIYPMLFTENPQFGSEIGYTRNKLEAWGKRIFEKLVNMNTPILSNLIKRKRVNYARNWKNIVLEN